MSALLELLKQKKQDMAASKRGRTEKLPDGNSRWRILGSWRGAGQQFWHDFGQHFVKDTAGKIQAIYVCTDKTFGKPCAVCDAVGQGIKGATDDATLKILTDAKSAGRVLVNALHLDSSEPHKVVILELPPTVFEQIVVIGEEWEQAGESMFGQTGKDLIINRTGTGKNTKYVTQVAARAMEIPPGICDKLHNLDEYVAQESSEQQTRALNSVRSLSGLLPAPAPSSGAGLPSGARGAATLDDDMYAAAPAPTRRPAEYEDVASKPVAAPAPVATAPAAAPWEAAPAPAAAPAAPAAAAASSSTGDAELDALISSLG